MEISEQATDLEIKKAYKKKAIQFHPDKNLHNPNAEEQFKAINTAYQILSNSFKKAEYDFQFQQFKIQQTQARQFQNQQANTYTRSATERPTYRRTPPNPNRNYAAPASEPYIAPVSNKEIIYFAVGSILFIALVTFLFTLYKNYNVEKNVSMAKSSYEVGDFIVASGYAEVALQQDLKSLEAQKIYSKILFEQERYKDAIHHALKALKLSKEYLPEMDLIVAKSSIELKIYTSAEYSLENILKLNPNDYSANFMMGKAKLKNLKSNKETLSDAIHYFNVAIELDSTNSEVHLLKGIALFKSAKYKEANSSYLKAREIDENNALIYHYMGVNELAFYQDTLKACNLFSYARNLGILESDSYIRNYCLTYYEIE